MALALVCVLGVTLSATPGFWGAATQADFLRGELENLSLDEHGRMTLGPRVEQVYDAGVPFIWTALEGRDGDLFLGTGNDGRVFKVDRNGRGSVFFDSSELEVHALAPAPDGGLYVATSPDGQIYKVDAKGVGTPFFDPEERYIWSLAVGRDGTLYAGTGDKGTVYKIDGQGKGSSFFSTKTSHAVSLAFDKDGHLVIGTGSPGRVFRVAPNGRGFLLLDTPQQEIRALRYAPNGDLYVAAQAGRPAGAADAPAETPAEAPRAPVATVSTEITGFAVIDTGVSAAASSSPASRESRRGNAGAIYRVTPAGLWDEIWESADDAPYDVKPEANGDLLVATGSRGKLYRLAAGGFRPTLVARVGAEQVTMLQTNGTRTLLATANPGTVVSLSNTHAERGSYESPVQDARTVATWGALSWRAATSGDGKVELFTRAGNSNTPDDTWSEWDGPYAEPNGSAIKSPNARYLQWRAVLTGRTSPVLTSVSAAYLQRNARPSVASITVHPPGIVFQRPFSTGEAEIAGFTGETPDRRQAESAAASGSGGGGAPSLGRKSYQKGLQTFVWKAEDENGDTLLYDVLFRRQGDTAWRLLKGGLADPIFVWDTSSAPNGTYSVKVVASDIGSNPEESALQGELESGSFDLDNAPPVVTVGTVRRDGQRFVIPIEVRDSDSTVKQVEYSLDTERWQSAFPRDGMLDARLEQLEIRLEPDAAGHTVVIRATDALNNVGGAYATVK